MVDSQIEHIIEECDSINELLKYDYIIKGKTFTGEEVLDLLNVYSYGQKAKYQENIKQIKF